MESTILTKINTANANNFAQICEFSQGKCNFNFLISFVLFCHKNAEIIKNIDNNSIDVFTNNGSYRYHGYKKHICKIDLIKNTNKKFFKIS